MSKIFLRAPHNYDVDKASDESGLACPEATLTKQSFAEECDINTIVRRFNLTGQLPTDVDAPTYADFSDIPDFQSAMNAVLAAQESFASMPADVRARFNNDPASFVDFCSDDANYDEAVKLGLIYKSKGEKTHPDAIPEGEA